MGWDERHSPLKIVRCAITAVQVHERFGLDLEAIAAHLNSLFVAEPSVRPLVRQQSVQGHRFPTLESFMTAAYPRMGD